MSPNSCVSMSCGKLPNGAACTTAGECNSNHLRAGRLLLDGLLRDLRVVRADGIAGTCSSVPSGQDPLNQCADQGVAMCGTDGSCNGSGACRRYAAGTSVRAGDLPDDVERHPERDLQRGRHLRHAGDDLVRAVRLRRGRVQDHLHDDRRLQRRRLTSASARRARSATNLTVQLLCASSQSTRSRIYTRCRSTTMERPPIPLSELTVRYWYTVRHGATSPNGDTCDYAHAACAAHNVASVRSSR